MGVIAEGIMLVLCYALMGLVVGVLIMAILSPYRRYDADQHIFYLKFGNFRIQEDILFYFLAFLWPVGIFAIPFSILAFIWHVIANVIKFNKKEFKD